MRRIPRGKVATYGQIAVLAGNAYASRQVARLLHSLSDKERLPWQRVINSRGQISLRGQSGERKYFWSNFPRWARLERLVEYAHRRHWVEQYHEEAKDVLGWDQYQGRRWGGFHRHAVLIMLAYSFLVWLEWHARIQDTPRGRRRGVFSPSAGSPSPFAGIHAAPHR